MMEHKGRFTEEEYEAMVHAVAEGQERFTEEDVLKLIDWILKVKIDNTFADMVLRGELNVNTTGKDLAFTKSKKLLERLI